MVKEYQERATIESANHLEYELDDVLRKRSSLRSERRKLDEENNCARCLLGRAHAFPWDS